MDVIKQLGMYPDAGTRERTYEAIRAYVRVKLRAMGLPAGEGAGDVLGAAEPLIAHYREQQRMLLGSLCPADRRIQDFLERSFAGTGVAPRLPAGTLVLDRHGLARVLSLPAGGDLFESPLLRSYRIRQGVLHNPVKDRRTTMGVFHVAEGGLPVPDDKKAVPTAVAARLFAAAMQPPDELMTLPWHAGSGETARCWVSLMLRPVVCPAVPGFIDEKRMETRFFAPASLIANLDFVESIFGNAGDPHLSENDAALDVRHWTGHTGCVILAPHLTGLSKKELGLPHVSEATDRQRRDGMCWEREDECYNDGGAFKLTHRDASGVIVTLIADNYFGYCKKEVKTQIGYSANLYGLAEEEHAGGALVFPCNDLGEDFRLDPQAEGTEPTFAETLELLGNAVEVKPEGHAVDRLWRDIVYVPEDVTIDLDTQTAAWTRDGEERKIRVEPGKTYVLPNGYKVEMVRPHQARRWRLRGVRARASFCHKPCTVSGGGKSEISKSLSDAIITGPMFVMDIKHDFDLVDEILSHDYADRFRDPVRRAQDSRPLLSPKRSLGSVIKLLTPSAGEYTDDYNRWVMSIPEHVKDLVITVKRFHKADWEGSWRERFSVDTVDGRPGNELRYRSRKIITQYLRVGYLPDGSWRIFNLRKDFLPAAKLSMEDDITASVVSPVCTLPGLREAYGFGSVKYCVNCENRFFQRPDDAIVRGYDRQAEAELSEPDNFLSNYEPLTREDARAQVADVIRFEEYTAPMRDMIRSVAEGEGPAYFCSTANPRMVDGKPTKNPRYLQVRPDLRRPRDRYLAEVSTRLHYRLRLDEPALVPVTAVLAGRRNNPPEQDASGPVRPLCVYNPLHYMELPELFMEFIASITGKSPSTTGAGSEGAMTKGPFNALLPVHDLNAALVSFLLTGQAGFVSCAGHVGPKYRVDHDISLLVPEIFSRMQPGEQRVDFLIREEHLERCKDFTHGGRVVRASRLGWRVTAKFMRIFGGRVFTSPARVFPEDMLRPELQDLAVFVDGVENICEAHERVARQYFADGSVERACPPLRALLTIMAEGSWEGKGLDDPEFRAMFTREAMLESEWYRARLRNRQAVETRLWERHVDYLEKFLVKPGYEEVARSMDCERRLVEAREKLEKVRAPERLQELAGTAGTDDFGGC